MAMYRIALIVATALSLTSSPTAAAGSNAASLAFQTESYAGVPRNTATGPVPKNAGIWIMPSDYPPNALASRRTGKTGFRLTVSSKGQVETCEVTESSGHPDLDQIACLRISERAVFEPARTAKGRRTAGVYQNTVRWRLP